jgi:gliding motility-associated-like protein
VLSRFTGVLCSLLTVLLGIVPFFSWSQANNNWSASQVITIPSLGFGLGNFSGSSVALDNATLEPGEYISNPIFQKSVWYTFTIATTRQVSISMALSGLDVSSTSLGFYVYRETAAIPLSSDLGFFTDGAVGATSTNECLTAGKYYLQICGSLPLSINVNPQVEISPTPSADVNDNIASPDNAGVITAGNQIVLDWPCLSLQSDDEYFPAIGADYLNYSKSYWVTFQTDSHIDLFSYSVELFAGGNYTDQVAVRIFEAPLTLASFNPANAIYSNSRGFHYPGEYTNIPCLLEANTTYVMQIIGRRDYSNTSYVYLKHLGEGETAEPVPTEAAWNAGNNFGTVTSIPMPGTPISLFDYFSCSSQMSEALPACNNVIPAAGYTGINNVTYDLTNWFTLNLTQESSLIVTSGTSCQACPGVIYNHSMYLRVFTQAPNNNCNSFQVPADVFYEGPFNGSGLCYVTCLPPGEYTLQIMGRSLLSGNPYECVSSQFGRRHDITVAFVEPAIFEYGMAAAGDVDEINNGNPLQDNVLYTADQAELTCERTVLPDEVVCWPTIDRAVYRTLEIGDADNDAVLDSGMLIIRNYNYQNFPLDIASNSALYEGDVDALVQSQGAYNWPDVVTGLDPLMDCGLFNQRFYGCYWWETYPRLFNMHKYCVTPGTYTLAQYGDSSDVGAVLQPTFEFRKDVTQFWNPAAPDNMGDLLATGLTHLSQPDTFSCLENPAMIDGIAPCGRTKLLYREFYLSQEAEIIISEAPNPLGDAFFTEGQPAPILFFSGQVSQVGIDGLSIVMEVPEYCSSTFTRWECESLPPGWYTVVSYGFGPGYENNYEFHEQNLHTGYHGCGADTNGLYSMNYISQISIQLDTTSSPGPFYYKPEIACVAPNTITYTNVLTPDFPSPFTEYVLCSEYFEDSTYQSVVNDEIFVCENDPPLDKVAYYVFTTDDEYFLRIRNLDVFRTLLYELDVTTNDSLQLPTAIPIVPCQVGFNDIEICSLPAGTYSLLVFADTTQDCINATPIIDVSPVNYSRFDFADRAYDFDLVPSDGTFHDGRVGDVHPTNPNLSPSNDFFYCTTGAFPSDPAVSCIGTFTDSIYGVETEPVYFTDELLFEQEILRRNLWYTFVVQGNGTATVEVRNLSSDAYANTFHVYSTDLSGEIPWSTITGSSPTLIDSTLTDSLVLKAQNVYWDNCGRAGAIDVNVQGDPCDSLTKRRFYIIVDRFHPRDYDYPYELFEALNGQIDVRIRWNRLPVAEYPGDECSDAVATQSTTTGVFPACTIIDCHTNVDPFWDLPENIDCMEGPGGRSSTWYKFNYNGPDVVDVGFQPDLSGLANYGLPGDIDYRVFYGNSCPTLIAGTECAQSSYISNTIACVDSTTGDFYVEVSYPENATGTLCFNFSVALNTNPNCIPFNPAAVEAYFQFDQVCTLDTVYFTNYSTIGLQMEYEWDFGHDNSTSNVYSPYHLFPSSGDYLVTLTATNAFAGTSDVYSEVIHVVDSTDLMQLIGDTTICYGDTLTLGRDLFQATYSWSTGAITSTIDVFEPGLYSVDYTVIGCPFQDQTLLDVFQLIPPIPDSVAICENSTLEVDFAPLDSIAWVNSPSQILETGLVQFTILPDSILNLPWIAYDQGCFVEGELEVVELYAFVPAIPSWDSLFCENFDSVSLPDFPNNTNGIFQYDGLDVSELNGTDFNPGDFFMDYIYTDSIGCTDTLQVPFTVLDTLAIEWITPEAIACNDADTIMLYSMLEYTSGLFYVSYLPNQTAAFQSDYFVPLQALGDESITNSYEVLYEVVFNTECLSRSFGGIVLQPDPLFDIDYGLQCEDAYLQLLNNSYVNGGSIASFVWQFETGEMQNISQPVFVDLHEPGYFTFDLEATSSFGCDVVWSDSVFVHPSPEASINYSSICQFDPLIFTSNATVEQGNLAQYAWYTEGQSMGTTPDVTWTFNNAGVFDVGVHVWSDAGCEGRDSLHVTIYPTPQLVLDAPSICAGDTIQAALTSSAPQDDVLLTTWFIEGVANGIDVDSIVVVPTSLNPVEIEVYQYSNAGCVGYASEVIDVFELPTLDVLPTDLNYCIGDTVSIGCLPFAQAPQNVQNTQWNFSNGLSFNSPSTSFVASSPGTFDAMLNVTTNFGCSSSFAVDNYVIVHPDPIANFILSDETPTYYEDEVDIINQSSSNVVEWNYVISDGFVAEVPNFSHRFYESGNYSIRLAVKDVHGCADTAYKSLDFSPDLIVHIPNSFTPDADGVNDVFIPVIDGDPLIYYRLIVFDRWGTIIFESFDSTEVWPGDVRENGYYAICDAYNYMLELKTVRGYEKTYTGALMLLR